MSAQTPTKNRDATARTKLTVALCGNPNSGKTTLFNLLTGANQKVGNWPGVTVEQKYGGYKRDGNIVIVDTPGVYSLSPYTIDEQITHNFLVREKPDVIIDVVDSTNLERNLFLTTQLLELDATVVVALNMQDEAESLGIVTDANKLSEIFGCKFVGISAAKNTGVEELMRICTSAQSNTKKPLKFSAAIERAISKMGDVAGNSADKRWLSLKLTENDKTAAEMCNLTKEQFALAENIRGELRETVDNVSAVIAKERYDYIAKAVRVAQSRADRNNKPSRSITQKIDNIVLNKWLAFPIFALVMAAVFYLSVDGLGGYLTGLINERFTPFLQSAVSNALNSQAEWLRSLIVDGIISGVMSVVGFLPQIMLLFGFISVLEACGYMSRIAFITDRLLGKIGLGGRSFVSMILGCGCSTPAIMATRTIKNVNERNATITLTPFMPCSAKLAVISFFTTYVFGGNALFAISFYFLSIAAVILGGLTLKFLHRNQDDLCDTFFMELPPYRAPTLQNTAKQMWDRGKAFLVKAGTIIFAAAILLWLLTNFDLRFQKTNAENSILASLGKLIAPIFYPLGFNDGGCGWQFAISTLSGIAAKETVVTTLEILLPDGLEGCISVLGAYSFVTYNLLTVPCVAAISASFTEAGWKNGIKSALFQIVTAYVVSLTIYQVGTFAQKHTTAFITAICVICIATALYFAVKYIVTHRGNCGMCQDCARCGKCHAASARQRRRQHGK